MTQNMPHSDQSQDLQDHYDQGASAHGGTSGSFEPTVNQVGLFDFSHNNNGFTELGIDPQSLPLWEPIYSYSESEFAYDSDAESGLEDTQQSLSYESVDSKHRTNQGDLQPILDLYHTSFGRLLD